MDEIKNRRNLGFIWAGITWAVLIILGFTAMTIGSDWNLAGIAGTLILSLFAFTFLSQCIWGGVVRNVACTGGAIIGGLGVIFSFDLDGFIFFIVVKLLMWILRIIIF